MIPKFAGHGFQVAILFVLSVIFTLLALSGLEFRLYPRTPVSRFCIRTIFEGSPALEIDRSITEEITSMVSAIPGVRDTHSTSTRGESRVEVSLLPHIDENRFQNALIHLLTHLKNLPPGAHPPYLSHSSSDPEAVYMAAFPMGSIDQTRSFADQISSLPGVGRVSSPEESGTRVIAGLDLRASAAAGLSPGEVSVSLRDASRAVRMARNGNSPGEKGLSIEITAPLSLLKNGEISGTSSLPPVFTSLLTLENRDLYPSRIEKVNGIPIHIVTVYADSNAGIISLCHRIEELRAQFPESELLFNRGSYLFSVLKATAITVILGIGAVVLFLLIQTGGYRRGQEYVILTLPFALMTSIVFLRLLNLSLDIMSLSGMAVASGLIIDTAVLFFEETTAHGTETAIRNVRAPILVANGTTIITFIPMLLMPEDIRALFFGFMVVVSTSLIAGSVWTLTVLPKTLPEYTPSVCFRSGLHRRYRFVIRITGCLGPFSFAGIIVAAAGLVFAAFPTDLPGFSPFPSLSTNILNLEIEVPGGMNPRYVESVISPITKYISTVPGELQITTRASYGNGLIRVRGNDPETLLAVRQRIASLRPSRNTSLVLQEGDSEKRGVTLFLYGDNPERLQKLIRDIALTLRAEDRNRTIYYHFKEEAPAYSVIFDPRRCVFHRTTPLRTARQLAVWCTSTPSTKFQNGIDHDLLIRPSVSFDSTHLFFQEIVLSNGKGEFPLSAVAEIHREPALGKINRRKGALHTGLTVVPGDSSNPGETAEAIDRILDEYPLPTGYHLDIAPELREAERNKSRIVTGLVLAALLVILVIYGYYENILLTAIVLMHIPPPVIISLLFLQITHTPVSIPVLSGMLVVIGISINSIVVLLPAGKIQNLWELRFSLSQKLPSLTASTITTIAGVAPLLAGSISRSGLPAGLSIVIAAGSLSAFFLLFFTSAIIEWAVVTTAYFSSTIDTWTYREKQP